MSSSNYSFLVPIMMFGWIPLGLLLCSWLGPAKGMLAVFVVGWLILPIATYKIEGLPAYTKNEAVAFSAVLALLVFDFPRLMRFRPGVVDLPMLGWCLCPAASSIANELTMHDAASATVGQVLIWGVPYLMGRLYCSTRSEMRNLAIAVVLGGVLYVPLCLFEIKMSPQLHSTLYGFHQHEFGQSKRFGGWRPTVFLQHGLAVGLYMSSSGFVALWLWRSRAVPRLFGRSMGWISVALTAVAVLCKSLGSVALLCVGVIVVWTSKAWRTRVPILLLACAAPSYMFTRASGISDGASILATANAIDEDRGDSFATRLKSENLVIKRAIQRPVFGWGGWGRSSAYDENGWAAISDGLWIIVFGKYGIVGLVFMTGAILLPAVMSLGRVSPKQLLNPEIAPGLALAVVVVFYLIDCLFNAMPNPLWLLAAGGLASPESTALAMPRPRMTPRPGGRPQAAEPSTQADRSG